MLVLALVVLVSTPDDDSRTQGLRNVLAATVPHWTLIPAAAQPPEETAQDDLATVTFGKDGCSIVLRPKDPSHRAPISAPLTRTLRFGSGDTGYEQGRAAGLALSSLLPDASPAPVFPPEAPSPPAASPEPPRPAPSTDVLPPAKVLIGVRMLTRVGLDEPETNLGAQLDGGWQLWNQTYGRVHGSFTRLTDDNLISGDVGVGLEQRAVAGRWFDLRVRVEGSARYLDYGHGGTRQARWVPAVGTGADLRLFWGRPSLPEATGRSPGPALVLGMEFDVVLGTTRVLIGEQPTTRFSQVQWVPSLGLEWAF